MSLNVLASSGRFVGPLQFIRSAPGERPPHHFEEHFVGLPEVAAELLKGLGAERRMRPPFGLVQALVVPGRQEAVETLGGVVVEVAGAYPGRQVQEPLCLPQLRERVPNEGVAVHHVDLLPWEDLQPARQVLVVQAPLQRLVAGVDVALVEEQLLQGLVGLVAGQAVVQDLGVVGDQPLSRVPDDEQQADRWVHVPDASRNLRCRKVAGCLLHRQLGRQGEGHLGSVPGQTSTEMLLHVEIVHLSAWRSIIQHHCLTGNEAICKEGKARKYTRKIGKLK